MNIQSIQNNTVYQSPQEIQEAKKQESAIHAPESSCERPAVSSCDEYVQQDQETRQPIGLYRVVHDEDGAAKIQFDDPDEDQTAPPVENCTTNTDRVDREIEKLKEKKNQLEQQLNASKDPQDMKKLEQQLARIEQELQLKDNDTYRRAHASISHHIEHE